MKRRSALTPSLCALALLGGQEACLADRLFEAPTARKIPFQTARFETMGSLRATRNQMTYLALGLGPSWELEVRSERIGNTPISGTFDLAYNLVSAIPGLSPGISFGIQDVMDKTRDRARGYLAVTMREPFFTINGEVPADITLGSFFNESGPLYMAVSIPFSREFRFMTEHNGIRLSFGMEIRPVKDLGIRMFQRDREVLASVQYSWRF